MRQGAILKSTIELITQIIENHKKPKIEIKNILKIIDLLVQKIKSLFKKWFLSFKKLLFLRKNMQKYQIKLNIRNSLLVYYFSENKKKILKIYMKENIQLNLRLKMKKFIKLP